MRRRALLAVSTISSGSDNPWGDLPAESTTFEFPLYINITKKNPDNPDEWLREADDLLEQLFDWLVENATIEDAGLHYKVPSELLASNNIYINGGLVEKAIYYSGSIELSGETIPFEVVGIDGISKDIYGYGAKLPQGGGGTYDEIFGNIPPESTEFGYPLYITVPFVKKGSNYNYYFKDPNAITQYLWDWFMENKVFVSADGIGIMAAYEATPPELYINGAKVIKMTSDSEFGEFYSIEIVIRDQLSLNIAWCTLYDDYSLDMVVN